MTERRLARSSTAKAVLIAVLIGGTALALWATLPHGPRREEGTAGADIATQEIDALQGRLPVGIDIASNEIANRQVFDKGSPLVSIIAVSVEWITHFSNGSGIPN